ncbi:MAG: type II secretion system F family protein [Endomicrobiales bacterium]|nr:type II secretion system F family protein [Endomicrobiales bacterium]
MVIIVSLLVGVSVALIVYSAALFIMELKVRKAVSHRLKQTHSAQNKAYSQGIIGFVYFFSEKLGQYLLKNKHPWVKIYIKKVQANLTLMGGKFNDMDLNTLSGFMILIFLSVSFLMVLLFGFSNPVYFLGVGLLFGAAPYAMLAEQSRLRKEKIITAMPDTIGLIALLMGAGLDFNSAFSKVISCFQNPLHYELAMTQKEINLGKNREEAFKSLSGKLNIAQIGLFVNTLLVSLKTGSAIADNFKTLAAQLREEQLRMAEKSASEAPLKLMFPLALLIFPTIFIILFGPIFLSFMGGNLF